MMIVGSDCSYYSRDAEGYGQPPACGDDTAWLELDPVTHSVTGVYCHKHRTSACVPIEGDLVKAPRSTFWRVREPDDTPRPARRVGFFK